MPNDEDVSAHLQSRLEVEEVLGCAGVPVTSLRAGLVIGANGSSYQLLTRLVQRLPIMVLPSWTRTKMQPVSEQEVVQAFQYVLGNPDTFGAVYDLYSRRPFPRTVDASGTSFRVEASFCWDTVAVAEFIAFVGQFNHRCAQRAGGAVNRKFET